MVRKVIYESGVSHVRPKTYAREKKPRSNKSEDDTTNTIQSNCMNEQKADFDRDVIWL